MLTSNGIKISSPPQDSSAQKVSMPEGECSGGKVPLIPPDVARWLMDDATSSGDEQYAKSIGRALKNNVVQHYASDLFDQIKAMEQACKPNGDINVYRGDLNIESYNEK